jgi:hypothetical protein
VSLLAGYLLFTGTGGGGAGVQVILSDLEAVMAGEVEAEIEPVEIVAEVDGEVAATVESEIEGEVDC